jgi:hypothetical protein
MMKILLAAFLLCGASVVVAAQDNTRGAREPSDVTVVKSSWWKERIGWEGDPFENFDDMIANTRNDKRVDNAQRSRSPLSVSRVEHQVQAEDNVKIEAPGKQQAKNARYVFTYKVSLRNDGAKAIRAVDWDYVFFDKGTRREVGRRQFASAAKIAPGKSKELSVSASQPPARTVSVQTINAKERDALDGRIEIVRVEYADGTIWKRH